MHEYGTVLFMYCAGRTTHHLLVLAASAQRMSTLRSATPYEGCWYRRLRRCAKTLLLWMLFDGDHLAVVDIIEGAKGNEAFVEI